MEVGTRVLIKKASNTFSLGIVTKLSGNNASVRLDKGDISSIQVSRLTPIMYFADWVKKDVDQEWVEKYSKRIKTLTYSMKTFFLLQKAQLCTIPLLTCMWYYANHYIYNDKLTLCKLKTSVSKRGSSGLYQYIPGSPYNDIISVSSKTNYTVRDIWTTLTHEMVHQFQYRIEYLELRTFDPASGSHGRSFKNWAPIIKELAGVPLTFSHNLDAIELDNNVENNNNSDEETDTSKNKQIAVPVILITIEGKSETLYLATKSNNVEDLTPAKNVIRAKFGRLAKIQTRTLSNLPLINAITSIKKNNGSNTEKINGMYFSNVPAKVFQTILKEAKPIGEK